MPLGNLTLSSTYGRKGQAFSAKINGLTTGRVEVVRGGADGSGPGFYIVNGYLKSESLPYEVSTVALREYEPGGSPSVRDSRIDVGVPTGTSRYNPLVLPSALRKVQLGQGSSTMLIYGTSNDVGSQASDAANNTDNRKNSWPELLADDLTGMGIKARSDGWYGTYYPTAGAPAGTDAATYDPTFAWGSFVVESRNGLGPRLARDNAGTTPMTRTPKQAYNALEIGFVINAVSGTSAFSVTVDGNVALASQNTSLSGNGGVERMGVTRITGLTKKVQLWSIARIAGDVRIAWVKPYCSDESEFIIANAAMSGGTTSQFNSTTFGYSPNFSPIYFPRDLLYFSCWENNGANGAISLDTTASDIATIAAAHGAVSPILWGIEGFVDPGLYTSTEAVQRQYGDVFRSIAAERGEAVVDFQNMWGSFAYAKDNGLMATDGIHKLKRGHQAKSGAILNKLCALQA